MKKVHEIRVRKQQSEKTKTKIVFRTSPKKAADKKSLGLVASIFIRIISEKSKNENLKQN